LVTPARYSDATGKRPSSSGTGGKDGEILDARHGASTPSRSLFGWVGRTAAGDVSASKAN
jgi:hypothetical protein